MSRPIIIIPIVLLVIISAAAVLYFTTDVFDSILGNENTNNVNSVAQNNTNQTTNISNENDSNSNAPVQNVNIINIDKVSAAATTGWETYESPAGFTFMYPAEFQEYSYDDFFGLHTPEEDTATVSMAMPQECYDKFTNLFNVNSDLESIQESTLEGYFDGPCLFLDITKESIAYIEELEDFMPESDSIDTSNDGTTRYSFAGIEGDLSVTVDEINFISALLSGEIQDYVFTIEISGQDYSQEEILATLKGVDQSLKLDETKFVREDPYADPDEDGLDNSFEELYGTKIDLADTDGDGYNDREEALNCYNPLGEGLMTGEYFVEFCKSDIASSSFSTIMEYENREALCAAWQPIAEH